MATDFMEQRVLLLISYILLMVLLLVANSCGSGADGINSNTFRVRMDDKGFNQRGELLYYHNKPFTGLSYGLFANGDTARFCQFTNGKQNGLLKWYYPNRQLAQLRFFSDGKKVGIHKGWWDDGTPKFEYHLVNDEYEGELKEWFRTGKLARLFHYKAGHEEGSEKMWWEDGKIRANYVIINGEKFGLFGQKLCVNIVKK
ncbi:toxin-antitoxin system YwqK family antitoxin [Mucilaginibacter sp. HMF5004]|uniref:toxin-antitoxin system YwqK family antitoxin n=1 Tax=Mucilaginibacter rivuli TaxID=2857527 RepID=UPI001C5F6006|nr:toxin-antitoxin system YwqK family antitoxin [Mucilaginibacter rivuli]MBW4891165.1 toxin-antitoxin system YwqK family antitoxin [Mucilaginibacter rivuli]